MLEDVLERRDEEARCAARGVEDGFVFLRVNNGGDEVNDVARGAELAGVTLRAKNVEQVFVGIAEPFAVVIGETRNFFQEEVEGFQDRDTAETRP